MPAILPFQFASLLSGVLSKKLLGPKAVRLYDSFVPLAESDKDCPVEVSQQIKSEDGQSTLLKNDDSSTVWLRPVGPRTSLGAGDVIGCFPPDGSTTASQSFLPHMVLSRRTLPWERKLEGHPRTVPWLALLLFRESELFLDAQGRFVIPWLKGGDAIPGPAPDQRIADWEARLRQTYAVASGGAASSPFAIWPISLLWARSKAVRAVLPTARELACLCHVRQLAEDDPEAKLDDDGFASIVLSNRLPRVAANAKPDRHVAALVSLEAVPPSELTENLVPLPLPLGSVARSLEKPSAGGSGLEMPHPGLSGVPELELLGPNYAPLVVLHYFTFTPEPGGNFRRVVQSLREVPQGGVLRFGALPMHLRDQYDQGVVTSNGAIELEHHGDSKRLVRGPFVPSKADLRPLAVNADAPDPRLQKVAIALAPDELESKNTDFTYAVAFELGRSLALADPAILGDLQQLRHELKVTRPDLSQELAVQNLPAAIRIRDELVNVQNDAVVFRYEPTAVGEQPGRWTARTSAEVAVDSIGPVVQEPLAQGMKIPSELEEIAGEARPALRRGTQGPTPMAAPSPSPDPVSRDVDELRRDFAHLIQAVRTPSAARST